MTTPIPPDPIPFHPTQFQTHSTDDQNDAKHSPVYSPFSRPQLVSTDNHSNVRNTQHTIAVDVPTLCRDDLVALPRSAGNRLQGTIAVVQRVTSVVQFVGPSTAET